VSTVARRTRRPADQTALGRRRWPRILAVVLAVLLVLVLVGLLGGGWYFSGRVLTVRTTGQAGLSIRAAGDGEVALSREGYADYLGDHGRAGTGRRRRPGRTS
jgi:hypothetical protein